MILIWLIINFSNGQVSGQLEHQIIIFVTRTDKNMSTDGSISSYSQQINLKISTILFCFSKKSLQITNLVRGQPEDGANNVDQLQIENEHSQKPSAHGRKESRQTNGHRYSIQSNDMALSDTVSNVVDFVKERHAKHRYRHNMHTRFRGSWSASSSPVHSTLPNRYDKDFNDRQQEHYLQYGTTSLQQRSRSPSPSQLNTRQFKGEQKMFRSLRNGSILNGIVLYFRFPAKLSNVAI